MNNEVFYAYVAGFFDGEGSVGYGWYPVLTITNTNRKLLEYILKGLLELDIYCTIRNQKKNNERSKQPYRLRISRPKSLINFYNCIPIQDGNKKEKLENIIKEIKLSSTLASSTQFTHCQQITT